MNFQHVHHFLLVRTRCCVFLLFHSQQKPKRIPAPPIEWGHSRWKFSYSKVTSHFIALHKPYHYIRGVGRMQGFFQIIFIGFSKGRPSVFNGFRLRFRTLCQVFSFYRSVGTIYGVRALLWSRNDTTLYIIFCSGSALSQLNHKKILASFWELCYNSVRS